VLQALKTFPSTTPERWERIAESIPGRGKKDCMKRLVIL
jgi:DnaJ family protein C protein 2